MYVITYKPRNLSISGYFSFFGTRFALYRMFGKPPNDKPQQRSNTMIPFIPILAGIATVTTIVKNIKDIADS